MSFQSEKNELRKRIELGKTLGLYNFAIEEYGKKRHQEKMERASSPDNILRMNIQDTIVKLLYEGKTVLEIIETLNEIEGSSKYSCYFESWIKNHEKKVTPSCKKEEER